MLATDILAYICDGAVICPDCINDDEKRSEETGAWFADDVESLIGQTCDACRAFYAPDGWTDAPAAEYRWSRCEQCNGQRPYDKTDRDARLEARRGRLKCHNCGGREHF